MGKHNSVKAKPAFFSIKTGYQQVPDPSFSSLAYQLLGCLPPGETFHFSYDYLAVPDSEIRTNKDLASLLKDCAGLEGLKPLGIGALAVGCNFFSTAERLLRLKVRHLNCVHPPVSGYPARDPRHCSMRIGQTGLSINMSPLNGNEQPSGYKSHETAHLFEVHPEHRAAYQKYAIRI